MYRIPLACLLLGACAAEQPAPDRDDSAADDSAIIGGFLATKDQYPAMVSIQYKATRDHLCGGTLIGDHHVLTAAHCLHDILPAELVVEAGVLDWESTGKDFQVSKITIHEDYAFATKDSDIALLTLTQSAVAQQLAPVAIVGVQAEQQLVRDGVIGEIAGWGLTIFGNPSDDLLYAKVPILTTAACQSLGYNDGEITENMFCAGVPFIGGADSCGGDSGGPLFIKRNGVLGQLGVISWGDACGLALPGVYTRISQFEAWIAARVPDFKLL